MRLCGLGVTIPRPYATVAVAPDSMGRHKILVMPTVSLCDLLLHNLKTTSIHVPDLALPDTIDAATIEICA